MTSQQGLGSGAGSSFEIREVVEYDRTLECFGRFLSGRIYAFCEIWPARTSLTLNQGRRIGIPTSLSQILWLQYFQLQRSVAYGVPESSDRRFLDFPRPQGQGPPYLPLIGGPRISEPNLSLTRRAKVNMAKPMAAPKRPFPNALPTTRRMKSDTTKKSG